MGIEGTSGFGTWIYLLELGNIIARFSESSSNGFGNGSGTIQVGKVGVGGSGLWGGTNGGRLVPIMSVSFVG